MQHRVRVLFWIAVCLSALPVALHAAAAPHKAVFTFGGLNERSGVLFVARDAGIFQKHGLDAIVVNVRNAQVGMSALASAKPSFTSVRPPAHRSAAWPAAWT